MWHLRRFFFVAPFATTIQLLRYFNPNRSLVICLLSSLYYPSFLVPTPLGHCPSQKSTKCNESLRNTWVKRRLILHKTTARFTQNNGSFYQKQRLVLLRRKTSAEAFAVISPRAHTLFYSYTSLRKAKIAQTSPICAEINLIIRNKTLTLPNLLRVF